MRNPSFVTHPPGQMWAPFYAVPLSVVFLGGCVDPSLDGTVTLDPTMVTRAFVHVDADPSVRAHVVYGDKNTDEATWTATPEQTGGALDFVLYLHGGASSSFRVEGTDARGHAVSGPLQDVTTEALPRMLPNFRSTIEVALDGLGPWLLTSCLSDNEHAAVVILSLDGGVVWYWQPGDAVVAAARYDALTGTVYGSAFDPTNDGQGYLFEIPVAGGEPVIHPLPWAHHDTVVVDNGDAGPLWAQLVTTFQEVDGQSIAGDTIVEVSRDGVQRVVWSAFDALTPTENSGWNLTPFPNGEPDWTHANGLSYEESEGAYYVSLWWPEQVIKVDRATGNTVWFMGGAENEFTFVGDSGFGPQHAPEFHDGRLGVFDNRDATEGSRAAEYLVDERARTATLEWSYTPEDPQYALVLGDTTRREDGSHLIAWGSTGDIFVTDANNTLGGLLRMEQPLAIGAVSEIGAMP
jgi:hypothetical protein